MISKQDIIEIDDKTGIHLNLYKDTYYLQPVSIVGDSIYLKTAAPTWKKNGALQVGNSQVVATKIGNKARTIKVLEGLLSQLGAQTGSRSIPQPGADNDDDFPAPF